MRTTARPATLNNATLEELTVDVGMLSSIRVWRHSMQEYKYPNVVLPSKLDYDLDPRPVFQERDTAWASGMTTPEGTCHPEQCGSYTSPSAAQGCWGTCATCDHVGTYCIT